MQSGNVNVYTIRKLIRINGFDIESEIGPIPDDEDHRNLVAKSPRSHTALTWASWKGNLGLVKCLIDEGASPNTFTSEELAAIHCSSMSDDNLPVLKYFLEHPRLEIDVNFCSSEIGVTPLMQACLFGAYNAAAYLLEQKAEVNHQDCEGKSPIFYAAKNGHLNVIKLLVAYEAVVCLRDNQNFTVLHHVIIAHKRKRVSISTLNDILIYLVEDKGLNVANKSINGSTALHEACRRGLTEVAKFLLEKGATLEAKMDGWKTPLWMAVMGKFPTPKLIMLLLEKGANFDVKNAIGMTMIQYAKLISKDESLVAVLEEAQKILRTNRMKAAYAMRRAILGSGNTFGIGFSRDSSYGSRREETPMIRWTGTEVKRETKMIGFVKKESVEDAYHGVYSNITAFCDAEVPIIKVKQTYDDNGTGNTKSEENYKCKFIKSEDKDKESESLQDAITFSDDLQRFNQVSSEGGNYDADSSIIAPCEFDGGQIENNNNEITFGDKDKALQEHPFERLVRKKKIEMLGGGKEENEGIEEEKQKEVVIPQKIKKIRRCSVIVSDDST